ncbi:MAG: hypothetical protein K8S62_05825 [Candidatus Sabulitectum sp.]|nr:hypothetical protein [Candidatus Sabulitectum sp.]
MKIDLDVMSTQMDTRERFGRVALELLGSGIAVDQIVLMSLSGGLFGKKGEILATDRYLSFKADRKLSKLKKSSSVSYNEISSLEVDSRSDYSCWTFNTGTDKFHLTFTNHGGRNKLNARDVFWYDVDAFPDRSHNFYGVLSRILSDSILSTTGLGDPEYHRNLLNTALKEFEDARILDADGITGVNQARCAPWGVMQEAFAMLLAGAAVAGERKPEKFMVLFNDLNEIWARILERLLIELERQSKRSKLAGYAPESTGEQFDRLSSLWYFHRIIRLNFAEKQMNPDDILFWSVKILQPRAVYFRRDHPPELRPKPNYELIKSHILEIRKYSKQN